MRRRKLAYAPEAIADLNQIHDWIANAGSQLTAARYMARVRAFIRTLKTLSHRGNDHGHYRPGLRSVGYEERLQVLFEVEADRVIIVRIFYGGQNWADVLNDYCED